MRKYPLSGAVPYALRSTHSTRRATCVIQDYLFALGVDRIH